ncbi:hypothetical protein F4777DRAFT_240883 [Nemania sp. FL0916]|nr:hypothetical protein F4777DRAFT_240883 [Nemania sp. FL0916]
MAAIHGKPNRASAAGQARTPIYARTSVLCNGQIVWKVATNLDMQYSATDPYKAELKPPEDTADDLTALNSLQLYRNRPLTPLELKQPLRHVQSSLPSAVRPHIYHGDLYGSTSGVFSCPDDQFQQKANAVFDKDDNDFFRRMRRAEYLLWDIEVEKGHWVAVVAHLTKSDAAADDDAHDDDDYDTIDQWCIVSARHSPAEDRIIERVRRRLPAVLRKGRVTFVAGAEIDPAIWTPMDETTWASGLFVYNVIKTLMHRVTEFYCRKTPFQQSFWDPLPGWMNLDEVRAEMQGRAAQRCMAATGYRSRIAIEGVRRWLGNKEVFRARELRPRRADSRSYVPGQLGRDGRCVLVDATAPATPLTPLTPATPGDDDDHDVDGNLGHVFPDDNTPAATPGLQPAPATPTPAASAPQAPQTPQVPQAPQQPQAPLQTPPQTPASQTAPQAPQQPQASPSQPQASAAPQVPNMPSPQTPAAQAPQQPPAPAASQPQAATQAPQQPQVPAPSAPSGTPAAPSGGGVPTSPGPSDNPPVYIGGPNPVLSLDQLQDMMSSFSPELQAQIRAHMPNALGPGPPQYPDSMPPPYSPAQPAQPTQPAPAATQAQNNSKRKADDIDDIAQAVVDAGGITEFLNKRLRTLNDANGGN